MCMFIHYDTVQFRKRRGSIWVTIDMYVVVIVQRMTTESFALA